MITLRPSLLFQFQLPVHWVEMLPHTANQPSIHAMATCRNLRRDAIFLRKGGHVEMYFMRCNMYDTNIPGQSRFEEAVHKRAVQIHLVGDMNAGCLRRNEEVTLRM